MWSTLQWQGAMAGASGCFFIRAKEGKPQSENIHQATQACASANLIPRHNKKQIKQKLVWEGVRYSLLTLLGRGGGAYRALLPPSHVFAYNRANTRTSVLNKTWLSSPPKKYQNFIKRDRYKQGQQKIKHYFGEFWVSKRILLNIQYQYQDSPQQVIFNPKIFRGGTMCPSSPSTSSLSIFGIFFNWR